MSALYPEVPAYLRISDAPTIHGGGKGHWGETEKRKRSFPWTYKLLKAAAAARAAGCTWQQITEKLIEKTGRQISSDAVDSRVLRFAEEEQ